MWHDHNFLLVIFGFVILIVLINQAFAAIKRGQTLKTIQKAMESGKEISPETLKALGSENPEQGDNLQGGVVLVAVSLGIALTGVLLRYGVLSDDKDAQGIMFAIFGGAAIPGFIGVALLLLHFMRSKQKD